MRRNAAVLFSGVLISGFAAALLVAFVVQSRSAEAAFPGSNGKMAVGFSRLTSEGTDLSFNDEIRTINPDGTGRNNLTDTTRANEIAPAWSADGTKIAFASDQDDASPYYNERDHEIYTMNADGSDKKRLTLTPNLKEGEPSWSPDGNRIVYQGESTASNGCTLYDLYVMDPDGTDRTRLTRNGGCDYTSWDLGPVWSPDGKKIAFNSYREGGFGVYVMSPFPEGEDNRPRRLADGRSPFLDWSPDGSRIALMVNIRPNAHEAVYEVYVMNADGSGRTRLTLNANNRDAYPAWSPDGKKIAFVRKGNVFVMDPRPESATNRPRQVTDYLRNNTSYLDWQPIPR